MGASFRFEKSLYSDFGPIRLNVGQEDGVLAFRAILKGEIYYLDSPLVKYRFHASNVSQSMSPARRIWLQINEFYMKKTWLDDAMLCLSQDKRLIFLLRKQCFIAYLRRLFFLTPMVGYAYNYLRIKVKYFLR